MARYGSSVGSSANLWLGRTTNRRGTKKWTKGRNGTHPKGAFGGVNAPTYTRRWRAEFEAALELRRAEAESQRKTAGKAVKKPAARRPRDTGKMVTAHASN